MTEHGWITTEEAAAMLDVSASVVTKHIETGRLLARKHTCSGYLIDREYLIELVANAEHVDLDDDVTFVGELVELFGRMGQLVFVPQDLFASQAVAHLSAEELWFVVRARASTAIHQNIAERLDAVAAETGVPIEDLRVIQHRLVKRGLVADPSIEATEGGTDHLDMYDYWSGAQGIDAYWIAQVNPILPSEGRPGEETSEKHHQQDVEVHGLLDLLTGGPKFFPVPIILLTNQASLRLTIPQVWFLLQVLSSARLQDIMQPDLEKLATRTGYSQEYLLSLKEQLIELGYLEIRQHKSPGRRGQLEIYDFRLLFYSLIALASVPA